VFERFYSYQSFLALAAIVAATASSCDAAAASKPEGKGRPNIVVVFVDDAGYADFPYFKDSRSRTPNIDRLCDEGLRFTQFYVNSPICSPSRAAFITGQYPSRAGITSFIAASHENARRGMRDWLDPDLPTLPRVLQQAGYATGHFGKWHLGGGRDVVAPLISEYGFDESLTQFEGMGERILPLLNNFDGEAPVKFPLGVASERLGHGNTRWVDRAEETAEFVRPAVDFIKRAKAEGRPFYVNLWPNDVHTPLHPPADLRGDGSKRELFLGVLENMDSQLAELFDVIQSDEELRQNTLIIVASDNGFESGAGSAGELRGCKGTLYEGGVRTPLIVWSPGLLDAQSRGSSNDQTVISTIDIVASLLAIARVEMPSEAIIDGEELSSALLGREETERTTPLFWVRPPDRPGHDGGDLPDLAVRSGKWKLLTEYDGSQPELYDLVADPNERVNIAGEHAQLVSSLTGELLEWRRTAVAAPSRDDRQQFTNPIFEGADPWVVQHDDKYIYCMSDGNRAIALHVSKDLTKPGAKHIVWQAPDSGPYSREIWAPELHQLDGRWYIYFAADDGDNRNHLSYVLESEGNDPLGPYELRGPIYTGDDPDQQDDNRWAIDATVLEHDGKRYLLWSGWADDNDEQWLYIAPMKSPWELAGPRVKLCHNADFLWERVGEQPEQRGLHEGPQVLKNEGRTFVVYSTSSSWQPTYKLGMLELKQGGNPLNPKDWKKFERPVFTGNERTYGVGHASFVKSPDGAENWIVYHAKRDRDDGWRRAVFAQPFHWDADGLPNFGAPVAAGELLDLPSGTPLVQPEDGGRMFNKFTDLEGWNYFGHHQLMEVRDGRAILGVRPQSPINVYRSGEKLIWENGDWRNFRVGANVRILSGDRDAGILFRVRQPSVGYDAQEGYFAGIIPRSGRVVLGATDGLNWRQIAEAKADISTGAYYRLEAIARGDLIKVLLDGEELISAEDDEFSRGTIGLRVVDVEASFSDVSVEPLKPRPKRVRQNRLRSRRPATAGK
jgi:arylsulfatase A-like enzyme/GH43 family beta-xylosidase